MPKFQFNKLVRDRLPAMYVKLNQQIVFQKLKGADLLKSLRKKLIEESAEIPFEDGSRDEVIKEMSDVYQVLDDIKTQLNISSEEIEAAKLKKFKEKGGFVDGIFVETIELQDDDVWVNYYRQEPAKYKEEGVKVTIETIQPGLYIHYKSDDKRYEVFGVGLHSETNEQYVVYKPLYKSDITPDFWVRPYDMFVGNVEVKRKTVPRFRRENE